MMVITDVSGKPKVSILNGQISLPLKMGLIGCSETSIRNYHYTLLISQESAVLI